MRRNGHVALGWEVSIRTRTDGRRTSIEGKSHVNAKELVILCQETGEDRLLDLMSIALEQHESSNTTLAEETQSHGKPATRQEQCAPSYGGACPRVLNRTWVVELPCRYCDFHGRGDPPYAAKGSLIHPREST
jgi:hypothetical protein